MDRLIELSRPAKQFQGAPSSSQGSDGPGQQTARSIKLDFPRFDGSDLEGWLFHEEEYFAFHNIMDNSRIQIIKFNMTKGALAWM